MEERGEDLPSRQRSLSADWIIDESWWGEGTDRLPADPPKPTGAVGCPHGGLKHREMHVYLGASTYLLVPVEYAPRGESVPHPREEARKGFEALQEALVVARNPPHTIMKATRERVQFLKAHARDVIVAQALLGIAQLEWEAFLVLLTASQVVAKLPQGELQRVTDAKILPIGIDNVGIHWHTGQVLSSPHGIISAGGASGDWAGIMAKRSYMLRSFKDLLKSGWLLFSWDYDCSRNQQSLAAAAQRCARADDTEAGTCREEAGGGRSSSGAARGNEWCLEECVKRGWDARFVWNATWMEPLMRSACQQPSVERWLVPLIYGFAEGVTCHVDKVAVELVLIARRSRKRAGVRFCRRGVDVEGSVANFVETEQIVKLSNVVSSFVCIRGSIPLFWKQDMTDWTQLKPKLSLASNEPVASAPRPSSCQPLDATAVTAVPAAGGAETREDPGDAKTTPFSEALDARDSHASASPRGDPQVKDGRTSPRCRQVLYPASAPDRQSRALQGQICPAQSYRTSAWDQGIEAASAASRSPLHSKAAAHNNTGADLGSAVEELGVKSTTGGGRESRRWRLNLHDVGLARHFDELRALYGNVFVLNLVERQGTEASLGALFRKTLSRYLCREALPNLDAKLLDSRLRDRSFSFCQVPSASEILSMEFSEGRGACGASNPEAQARTPCQASEADEAARHVLAEQARPQHAGGGEDEHVEMRQHDGVVRARPCQADGWQVDVPDSAMNESRAGNMESCAGRADSQSLSEGAGWKDAVSDGKTGAEAMHASAGCTEGCVKDDGRGGSRPERCGEESSQRRHDGQQRVGYLEFAMHSAVKGQLNGSTVGAREQLQIGHVFGGDLPEVQGHGIFVAGFCRPATGSGAPGDSWLCDVMMKQSGVLRINCVDCLDRTNVAMSLLARWTFVRQLEYTGVLTESEARAMYSGDPGCFPNAQDSVVGLWAAHGDALSLQYAGSQALQSDVTRTGRRTLQGLLTDSVTSVQRYVQHRLYDSSTQEMLDWLLGQAEPALLQPGHSQVEEQLMASPLLKKQVDREERRSSSGNLDEQGIGGDSSAEHGHTAEPSGPSTRVENIRNADASRQSLEMRGVGLSGKAALCEACPSTRPANSDSGPKDLRKLGAELYSGLDSLSATSEASCPEQSASVGLAHAMRSAGDEESLRVLREEMVPASRADMGWLGLAGGWVRGGRGHRMKHAERGGVDEGVAGCAIGTRGMTSVGEKGDEEHGWGDVVDDEWELIANL